MAPDGFEPPTPSLVFPVQVQLLAPSDTLTYCKLENAGALPLSYRAKFGLQRPGFEPGAISGVLRLALSSSVTSTFRYNHLLQGRPRLPIAHSAASQKSAVSLHCGVLSPVFRLIRRFGRHTTRPDFALLPPSRLRVFDFRVFHSLLRGRVDLQDQFATEKDSRYYQRSRLELN